MSAAGDADLVSKYTDGAAGEATERDGGGTERAMEADGQ